MERTKLRNESLKDRMHENRKRYLLQGRYCVSLFRKMKKEYNGNLDREEVSGDKIFWKIVKPFLSDKIVSIKNKSH